MLVPCPPLSLIMFRTVFYRIFCKKNSPIDRIKFFKIFDRRAYSCCFFFQNFSIVYPVIDRRPEICNYFTIASVAPRSATFNQVLRFSLEMSIPSTRDIGSLLCDKILVTLSSIP